MIRVEVKGEYALFTRPEMKTERVSYDVMTASAARGLLEAIFWHPGLRWVIDRIYVLNPIQFTNIRRNEVSSKLLSGLALTKANNPENDLYLVTSDIIQQRASLVLKDVHYVIDAHFEMTEKASPSDNPGKFQDMMRRRLRKGQCYHMPYLGTREFPASFQEWEGGDPEGIQESRDLGFMLLDMNYSDPEKVQPIFHRAQMSNGIIKYPDPIRWISNGGGEVIR